MPTVPFAASEQPTFDLSSRASSNILENPSLSQVSKRLLPVLVRGNVVERKLLRRIMEVTLGGSDTEGVWTWKDAYDATEGALALFLQQYGKIIAAQGPRQALVMLDKLQALTPTHTRRTEESQALQQFSTPLALGFLASHAAQLRASDTVLEPSAGTGLLAVHAAALRCRLLLNEVSERRASLLADLFADFTGGRSVTRHNAEQIDDYLDPACLPDVILMNPPFSASPNIKGTNRHVTAWHIASALARLKEKGRLVAITGQGFAATEHRWRGPFKRLQSRCRIVFSAAVDGSVFKKHGTTVDTRLTVFDKLPADDPSDLSAYRGTANSPEELLELLQEHLPARLEEPIPLPDAETPHTVSTPPRQQTLTLPPSPTPAIQAPSIPKRAKRRAAGKTNVKPNFGTPVNLAYETRDWKPAQSTLRDVVYEAYEPQSIVIPCAKPHPDKLMQSAAMASVAGPKPTYVPKLPEELVAKGILSDAQLESIIYAGEAHAGHLSGHFTVDCAYEQVERASEDNPNAVQFRRGWFLGDGTGTGKGRQVAGIFLDNWLKGRKRGVWISKSDKLVEDARRDWLALGGVEAQVVPLAKFKQGSDIALDEGILFVTYGTLRTGARQGGVIENEGGTETAIIKKSRVNQIVDWLGAAFDGVIAFDESHAMANAAPGKGARGDIKASLQGLAGLRLQHGLPDARIVYVSATGATEVAGLAYATRFGLWGTGDFPFNTRSEFVGQMEAGGVAAMEVISRDLKSLGLYTARSLSYEGVKYDALVHTLTPEQIRIYDSYADAFKVIHHNIDAALELTNITSGGQALNGQARGAARSVFESTKQRFFNHLLTAMKCPSLIKSIQADLDNGDAVVVQIVSTCEALLDRRLADIPASEWNDLNVDITPREYVLNYLQHSFPTNLYETYSDDDGELRSKLAAGLDGNLIQSREAVARRDALIEKLASLPALPGALDQLIQHFGTDQVAEVTGRSKRIIQKDGKLQLQKRPGSSNIDETWAFMNDEKPTLVFSDAGGTGRSYHADLSCKNQRQRIHYLLEPGWKADTAIQGLGRTHRTNQATPPVFRPTATDVKGERRFISTIARRLDTLGAITRGQRETGSQNMFRPEDNLESGYARAALRQLYFAIYDGQIEGCSLSNFESHTGLRLASNEGTFLDELPPITQFLNRMLALRIALQNNLFDAFETRLVEQVAGAKEAGVYDLGVETLIAHSFRVLERAEIYTHSASNAKTQCLKIEQKDRTRPTLLADILQAADREEKARFFFNQQSRRVALSVPYTNMISENGDVIKRVRMIRPLTHESMLITDLDKSHWREIERTRFEAAWDDEVAAVPAFTLSEFHIVTGLLLPIWKSLPNGYIRVNRLQTSDGERIIGRVLTNEQLPNVYSALGLGSKIELSPLELWEAVIERGSVFQLSNGWALKRSRVMDDYRFEVVGPIDTDLQRLRAVGLIVEIINWKARLFIPRDGSAPDKLKTLLDQSPVISAA